MMLKVNFDWDNVKKNIGYRNIQKLGNGSISEVWLVEEEKTGKKMALKLIDPRVTDNEKTGNCFSAKLTWPDN